MSDIAGRILEIMQREKISYGELSASTGIPKSALQRYATGETEKIPIDRLEKIAKALHVDSKWLLGWEDDVVPFGFEPLPETEKVPLVGSIACGEPITAEENIEDYVDVPKGKNIDFCLTCKGESMIEAGIYDGDIVYIHQQAEVENGEIAAVRIGNEATLKRFYYDGIGKVTLLPANSKYAPLTYSGEEINEIHIEGKAVGFAHWF